jgi:outer membrane receptor protein involved in Fe transport
MNTSTTVAQYTPMQTANTEMYAVYAQNDFRITPKLSVNLNLRYEYKNKF